MEKDQEKARWGKIHLSLIWSCCWRHKYYSYNKSNTLHISIFLKLYNLCGYVCMSDHLLTDLPQILIGELGRTTGLFLAFVVKPQLISFESLS